MSRNTSRFSPLRFILALLLVVVLAAGAFGGYLYYCAGQVGEHFRQAQNSYDQCLTLFDTQDFDGALSSMRSASEEVALAKHGLEGWQWDIAAQLPVISQDVTCAREAADISDSLTNQAMMPMLSRVEEMVALANSDDPLSVLGKIGDLYGDITTARGIVSDCKTRAYSMGTSHFDGVNELVSTVRQATTDADDAFASIDPLLDAINGLGALAEGIGSALTAPVDTGTTSA